MSEAQGFKSRQGWREWLTANHAIHNELWVVFEKKRTGKQGLRYDEAVEEAVCFGWIDGIRKRRDDSTFMQKFTPRRMGGSWSELNLRRARRMIDEGQMTAAGLAMLGDALVKFETEGLVHTPPRVDTVPEELMAILEENPASWAHFQRLPPSHRRQYLSWVAEAKREETRVRRMKQVADVLAKGTRLGMK
ncbi:YdeI/OmpD-associated family protein [Candidatus Fermentibacteria bacterium]|nr:YdeI/OmpD-associated family protein [Candidatus Fermentibacteria bacterium]